VDGSSTGEELMESKRKEGLAVLILELVAQLENRLQPLPAEPEVKSRFVGKTADRSFKFDRFPPYEPAILVLSHAKSGLHPRSKGVAPERLGIARGRQLRLYRCA